MLDHLSKIFRSQKTLWISFIVAIVSTCYLFLRNIVFQNKDFGDWCDTAYFSVLVIIYLAIILYTFTKHNENSMKPATGMLLGVITFQAVSAFVYNIVDPDVFKQYLTAGASGYISLALDSMQFLFALVFCFNHIAISSGHQSNARNAKLNVLLCLLLLIDYILQVVVSAFIFSVEKVIYYVAFYLVLFMALCTVVSVEVKLDYFRCLRAQNSEKN